MSEKVELEAGKAYVVQAGLLGGWFCIDETVSESENLDKIYDLLKECKTMLELPMGATKETLKDRLFGGFKCNESETRRHVYFALGHYSFLNPEVNSRKLTDEERQETWKALSEAGNTFLGGNCFTYDKK
jgi:hypothetical protein